MGANKNFVALASVDVSGYTEQKNGLTFLSWAHAWAEACKVCTPIRKVYKSENGWNYHTDGRTCWVEVGVSVDGVEHIDNLPVMDFRNKSIGVDAVTSFDVNKAIQRSTVKALALHGLGLNVYAGEDLPLSLPAMTPKALEDAVKWGNDNGKTAKEVYTMALSKYSVSDEQKLLIEKSV